MKDMPLAAKVSFYAMDVVLVIQTGLLAAALWRFW